jgi:valyl-tRNA synthetase
MPDLYAHLMQRVIGRRLSQTSNAEPFSPDFLARLVHPQVLLRVPERQKISKAKGNVIDLLELIDCFGIDGPRIAVFVRTCWMF